MNMFSEQTLIQMAIQALSIETNLQLNAITKTLNGLNIQDPTFPLPEQHSPTEPIPQPLPLNLDARINAIVQDIAELKEDYDILAYSLATTKLTDEDFFTHRQRIVRAARKLLVKREAELVGLQREKMERDAEVVVKRE